MKYFFNIHKWHFIWSSCLVYFDLYIFGCSQKCDESKLFFVQLSLALDVGSRGGRLLLYPCLGYVATSYLSVAGAWLWHVRGVTRAVSGSLVLGFRLACFPLLVRLILLVRGCFLFVVVAGARWLGTG